MAFRLTINLGNSIIGVSILTMPYCFMRCGILLSVLSILVSGLLNRAGCHLIFRCAVMTRKRSFEEIALQVLGPFGKLLVELCVLGFLMGTCVAYFVVIGDLGPSIVSDVTGLENTPHLRAFTMTLVGMFVALPLGLLRRVDSLASLSALSFIVYLMLAVQLFSEASVHILIEESQLQARKRLVWWNPSGLLQNIPIFAMSLSCQTQLFELFDHSILNFDEYDVVPKLNRVVRRAVHLCSLIYVSIGAFGYIAFHNMQVGGNILAFLQASFASTVMKVAFVATVAVSLPLCLFPCRTSLYSLFLKSDRDYSKATLINEFVISPSTGLYMSDKHFRFLTVLLIVFTVCVSIIVPRIEFVLSIVGSTTGTTICFILPGILYSQLVRKNTTEKLAARCITYFGFAVLIICTFASLNSQPLDPKSDVIAKMNEPKQLDLASLSANKPVRQETQIEKKQETEKEQEKNHEPNILKIEPEKKALVVEEKPAVKAAPSIEKEKGSPNRITPIKIILEHNVSASKDVNRKGNRDEKSKSNRNMTADESLLKKRNSPQQHNNSMKEEANPLQHSESKNVMQASAVKDF